MPTTAKAEAPTLVLFRVFTGPDGGDAIAVFPAEPWSRAPGSATCYQHVGQHGECFRSIVDSTRPATPAEYASLKAEIEAEPYGYVLKVRKRWPARTVLRRAPSEEEKASSARKAAATRRANRRKREAAGKPSQGGAYAPGQAVSVSFRSEPKGFLTGVVESSDREEAIVNLEDGSRWRGVPSRVSPR